MTSIDATPEVDDPVTDDGDRDRLAHYAKNDELAAARREGRAVKALCGTLFHPSPEAHRFEVCVVCKELAAGYR